MARGDTVSDPILTPEQTYAWIQDAHCDSLLADDMVYRSHEALRSRLAEVEAERDEAVRRSALDEAQCDHMTDTAGRLAVELAAAEARLAEAVELLRALTQRSLWAAKWVTEPTAVARARVFIEEQGQ